jgi:hypothetical protein
MRPRIGTQRTASTLQSIFGASAFRGRDARVAGISPDRLSQAVRAGRVERLRQGIYSVPATDNANDFSDDSVVSRAALECERFMNEGVPAVIGGRTAALLWGIPVIDPPGRTNECTCEIVIPEDHPVKYGRREGLFIHHFVLPDSHRDVSAQGVAVTSPIRTAIDVSRGMPAAFAVVPLSAALRIELNRRHSPNVELSAHALTDLAQQQSERDLLLRILREVIHDMGSSRGLRGVRSAANWADPRLESGLESLSWGRMWEADLIMPVPQSAIRGFSGRWFRGDFEWLHCGLVGEADGAVKYHDPEALWKEKERHLDIERTGRRIIRWTFAEMAAMDVPAITLIRQHLNHTAPVIPPFSGLSRPA